MKPKIHLILAVDEQNGLGKEGKLAWHIPRDLQYFKDTTSDTDDLAKLNAVIMGRSTWESIPPKHKPLSNRINCILTRAIKTNDMDSPIDDFVLYFNSLEKCLEELENKENLENIFVIGGASLYNQLIYTDLIESIYLTEIQGNHDCDVFFDGIPANFSQKMCTPYESEGEYTFRFCRYDRIGSYNA